MGILGDPHQPAPHVCLLISRSRVSTNFSRYCVSPIYQGCFYCFLLTLFCYGFYLPQLKFLHFPVGGAGFEPAKALPSDLQSDPFDRSGNPPPNPTDVNDTPGAPAAKNQRTSAIGPTLTIKLPPTAQKLPTPARWLLTDNFTPHHYSFVY